MIDVRTEQVFPLAELPARLPLVKKGGRRIAISTAYRWATAGRRGIRLETLRVGGTLVTSLGACQAFFEACSRADRGAAGPVARPPGVATGPRLRAIEAADRELDRLGV